MNKVFVYDPTSMDKLSSVRGIGRYLQILKENFPSWRFTNNLKEVKSYQNSVFINPFFNFLQPPLVLKRIAKKQIAVIHDLIPLKYPSHFPAGLKGSINIFLNKLAVANNYDIIVTDSEASKKDIINILNINENKIKVIYPCLPKTFANKNSLDKNQYPVPEFKYCLYVGDATWNKNLVNLAKAIKTINITCLFVGNIFEEKNRQQVKLSNNKWLLEYKEFLNEVKNDKRFVFVGFVNDFDLIKLYQQAVLNILPSRDEGFGFSYLEAAQNNCPSVLSNIPVLKEISGGNALFANETSFNDLADKIGELYFNNEIRSAYTNKAKKQSSFFSPEKFKKNFLNIV